MIRIYISGLSSAIYIVYFGQFLMLWQNYCQTLVLDLGLGVNFVSQQEEQEEEQSSQEFIGRESTTGL